MVHHLNERLRVAEAGGRVRSGEVEIGTGTGFRDAYILKTCGVAARRPVPNH